MLINKVPGHRVTRVGRDGTFGRSPWLPSIADGLTFMGLVDETPVVFSAAGTTDFSTKTVDPDGTYEHWFTGLITDAATNTPRWTPRGVLSEVASENVCLRSEEFSHAAWTAVQRPLTRTDNSVDSPRDDTTAALIADNATTSGNYGLKQAIAADASSSYTFTIFLKKKDYDYVQINLIGDSSADHFTYFDISTGALAAAGSGVTTRSISEEPNGYYRCRVTVATDGSDTQLTCAVVYTDTDSTSAHVGVVGTGTYYWGAQLEKQADPTTYIPTTSASVTRSADDLRIAAGANIAAAAGTIFVAFTPDSFDTSAGTVVFSTLDLVAGKGGTRWLIGTDAKPIWQVYDEAAAQASLTSTNALVAGTTAVLAGTWGTNDFRSYVDAADEKADVSGSAPSGHNASMFIGQTRANTVQAKGGIALLTIYNRCLTAAEIGIVTREIQAKIGAL
jgi:hypothetical protein